jgi:hypothetical protein
VDEVGVTVIPPPRRARVTVTFAAVTVEDADALGGGLALRLAVGDQAARWPEEGAVDVLDGKRFQLDQRFDLVLNPSSVLTVTVAGEDVDGSPAGLVREPYLGLDDWAPAITPTAAAPPHRPRTPGAPMPASALDGRARHRGDHAGELKPGRGAYRPGRPRRPMMRRLAASAAAVGRAVRAATTRRLRAGTT